jgi:hypothetical protein
MEEYVPKRIYELCSLVIWREQLTELGQIVV